MTNRPTYKELDGKIRQARDLVSRGRVSFVSQEIISMDAEALGFSSGEEMAEVLSALLGEILPEHYAGANPPQRSYEERIRGSELFAFRLEFSRFGRMIYLKFALVHETLWVVSLHPDRPLDGERP